jgi:uncharacterized protein (DUF2384 family)
MYVVAVELMEMSGRSHSGDAKISGSQGTKKKPKERQAVLADEAAADEERVRPPLSKREREVLKTFHLLAQQSADLGLTAKRRLAASRLFEALTKGPVAKSKSAELFADFIPVVAHALGVFGDEQKTSHWFATPLAMLRGQTPSQLLAEGNAELVDRILTRIEHNIPS